MEAVGLFRTLGGLFFLKHPLYRRASEGRSISRKTLAWRTYQTSCEALVYRKHGPCDEVLKLEDVSLPCVGDQDIHIRMLAAPINPADINMLQGRYGILPHLPAIGGNEGVGEVIKVGYQVHNIKPGEWVIPIDCGFGDTVIQNGANSAVGQAVIQICALMRVNTINVIRDRSNFNILKEKLLSLGANYVITEDMLEKPEMANLFKVVERPKLALNCVGGSSAGNFFAHLKDGSTMVTYGGMSRKPTPLPAKALIFKNIKMCGFWMTQWKRNNMHDLSKLTIMVSDLTGMIRKGQLLEPICTEVPFQDYKKALQASRDTYSNKHVLIMK